MVDIANPKLGDVIEKALSSVGITSDLVSKWIGKPCGCKERKEKLNQLDSWARRVLNGATDKAKEYLNSIMGNEDKQNGNSS